MTIEKRGTLPFNRTGLLCTALLVSGCAQQHITSATSKNDIAVAEVTAVYETTPVASRGDAADDPAIWVHPRKPGESRVLGTDKRRGLMVYDLRGEQVQALAVGRVNNVDLRQALEFDNTLIDIAVATNRTDISLDVFVIDRDSGEVRLLGQQPLDLTEPYGVCMYRDSGGAAYAFVNDKDGRYQQWHLRSLNPFSLELVRRFQVATQPEGCAADDTTGQLFVGEEGAGVWQLSADPQSSAAPVSIDSVDADVLVADVEGMDIYRVDADTAYLIVSSQGDYTYAVYQLGDQVIYRGSFRVIDTPNDGVDGAEETDGLAVTNANLGAPFETGMMVFQDGFNRQPKAPQNFKYVPWHAVAEALGLQSRQD